MEEVLKITVSKALPQADLDFWVDDVPSLDIWCEYVQSRRTA